MYYGYDEKLQVFLQQDGYLDKEQILVKDLPAADRPLNQKWSWDRILRSCYIKQADVLQGIYFFEDRFDLETIRRNFDFYEPRTVHESSLSPCVHAILAAKLGDEARAYEFYLRTARIGLIELEYIKTDGLLCRYIALNNNIIMFPFFGPGGSLFGQHGVKSFGADTVKGTIQISHQIFGFMVLRR